MVKWWSNNTADAQDGDVMIHRYAVTDEADHAETPVDHCGQIMVK